MTRSTVWRSMEQMRRWLREPGRGPLRAAGVMAGRTARYLARRLRGPVPFTLGGEPYAHFVHPFILDNERTVEIPLALRRVEHRRGDRILEVGHVLSAYARFEHVVVDRYESAEGVINEDIVDFRPDRPFDLILCVSTLEHVGWDESPRDDAKIPRALDAMRSMLAPGGELFVTMPLGYNPVADGLIAARALPFDETRFLRRVSANNRWVEAAWEEVRGAVFGRPFACANAVVAGWIRRAKAQGAQRGAVA